jgi:hypothetical protein
MADWSALFRDFLETRFAGLPDADAIREEFAWVTDLHELARERLDPQALEAMEPGEVYGLLKSLSVPGCPIRISNLGRTNEAPQVTEALVHLLRTPGDLRQKFRAGKIPQAGVVTLSEILCIAKPHRFILRNTALSRALAKVVPFYSRRALEELAYEEFLDICRELAKVQETFLSPMELGQWARDHRFLLLYAVLTPPRK